MKKKKGMNFLEFFNDRLNQKLGVRKYAHRKRAIVRKKPMKSDKGNWMIRAIGIILLIIILVTFSNNWMEKNCDLEFEISRYSDFTCFVICDSKCYKEGFGYQSVSSSYEINPPLSNYDSYRERKCFCKCEGCRSVF